MVLREFLRVNAQSLLPGFCALLLCSFGALFAGVVLGYFSDNLILVPGLMVLIPPAIGMRGNIFGALGARLGTALHLGTLGPGLQGNSVLRRNSEASLVITVASSVALGLLVAAICWALGVNSIPWWGFVFISVIGGILASMVVLGFTIAVALASYRRGWDMDNVSAPIVAAIGDLVTVPMLFIAAMLFLEIPGDAVLLIAIAFMVVAAVYWFFRAYRGQPDMRRIVAESIPIVLIAAVMSTFAGIVIEVEIEAVIAAAWVLVIIPVFLLNSGALASILSARLSSGLHSGTVPPDKLPGARSLPHFAVVSIFAVAIYPIIGILTFLTGGTFGITMPDIWFMAVITSVAGLALFPLLALLSYYVSVVSFRFGIDPDNVTIPVICATADVIGVWVLLGVISIVGVL